MYSGSSSHSFIDECSAMLYAARPVAATCACNESTSLPYRSYRVRKQSLTPADATHICRPVHESTMYKPYIGRSNSRLRPSANRRENC